MVYCINGTFIDLMTQLNYADMTRGAFVDQNLMVINTPTSQTEKEGQFDDNITCTTGIWRLAERSAADPNAKSRVVDSPRPDLTMLILRRMTKEKL